MQHGMTIDATRNDADRMSSLAPTSIRTSGRRRFATSIVSSERRGKGNALARGFATATGEISVMLDADGSADTAEIPAYAHALVHGTDFATDSRHVTSGGSTDITARGISATARSAARSTCSSARVTPSAAFRRIRGTS
jgi:hypothetical protein